MNDWWNDPPEDDDGGTDDWDGDLFDLFSEEKDKFFEWTPSDFFYDANRENRLK